MWLVWSYDDGVTMITVDKDKAIKEYEELKQSYIDSFDGEFNGDEHVILAKVEKRFYCADTGEPMIDYDDNGNEFETGDTYWDWREDEYK